MDNSSTLDWLTAWGTFRELAHIHGRELAGRVAIETTTKEDTEMARTRKTDETTENIVPLRPDAGEQPQVDDQPTACSSSTTGGTTSRSCQAHARPPGVGQFACG